MKSKSSVILVLLALMCSQEAWSQIHFHTLSYAYDKDNNKKGVHMISAEVTNGYGEMTIEQQTMRAEITNTVRNNTYGITAYALLLTASNGKKVNAAVSKYDNGNYTVVVDFADGSLRYDIEAPITLAKFVKTQTRKITYDETFQPTLHLSFKNVSNKTITSIEVIISYGQDSWKWYEPSVSKIAQINLSPGEYGTVHISARAKIDGHELNSFGITRIRFSDGSICDR